MRTLQPNTALLVLDVQAGFDHPDWGRRNNPEAEAKVAALLAVWRAAGAPVIHAHHDSPADDGLLRSDGPGHAVKPDAQPLPGEPVYNKRVNSAFIGTSLEADLRAMGVSSVVVVGLTTNHCVSTTARMAGNLGFDTFIASDATATFDRLGLDGRMRPAEDVHAAALSDLQEEFAEVVDSDWLMSALADALEADPAGRNLMTFKRPRHA